MLQFLDNKYYRVIFLNETHPDALGRVDYNDGPLIANSSG